MPGGAPEINAAIAHAILNFILFPGPHAVRGINVPGGAFSVSLCVLSLCAAADGAQSAAAPRRVARALPPMMLPVLAVAREQLRRGRAEARVELRELEP
jgi:hypothetical protein